MKNDANTAQPSAELKVKQVCIIGRLSDGSIRQVFISKDTEYKIMSLALSLEGELVVSNQALHGIDIESFDFNVKESHLDEKASTFCFDL